MELSDVTMVCSQEVMQHYGSEYQWANVICRFTLSLWKAVYVKTLMKEYPYKVGLEDLWDNALDFCIEFVMDHLSETCTEDQNVEF